MSGYHDLEQIIGIGQNFQSKFATSAMLYGLSVFKIGDGDLYWERYSHRQM